MGAVAITMLAIALPASSASAFNTYEGAIHEHTAYSDGEPGKRPADAFGAVRDRGSDFMFSTEHSDTEWVPVVTNTVCLGPRILECVGGDATNPLDALRKWAATAEQADAATNANFVGVRGFEWTNDHHGHLSVLFSQKTTNAKIDGSYLSMDFFWNWFTRSPGAGGGADALGVFNHPGAREVSDLLPGGFLSFLPAIPLPGANWDDFKHIPAADGRMVGMELFNGGTDYSGSYVRALDKGWHVGAIGAEDTHDTSWGVPEERKTVMLASALTRAGLREAMEARRFYAVHRAGLRMTFTADGAEMGARLTRAAGAPVQFEAATNQPGATVELVTSGGQVVASGAGALSLARPAAAAERWYFVRVKNAAGDAVAYSSPIWVAAS